MEIRECKKLVFWYFKNLSRSHQRGQIPISVVRFHYSGDDYIPACNIYTF